jgi:flagellar secretion chaperone FliS
MNPNTASLYRQNAVRGATPLGLVVILYEEVIRSLQEALNAIDRGKIEERSVALTHVLGIVGHLQAVLDYEKGGEIARKLSGVYNSVRDRVLQANATQNRDSVQRLLEEFRALAETWREVERRETPQSQPGAAPASREAAPEFSDAAEDFAEQTSQRWSG